jgi:acetyl esterase/lipase
MSKYLFVFLSIFFVTKIYSQDMSKVRYKDLVFSEVNIQKDISYSPGEHPGIKEKHYRFDLYEPKSDNNRKRPLIIWLHGGGFKFGSKNARGIKLWSETFAKRGYVSAALNYRLSKKNPLFNFTELQASCYNAVEDIEEAIAFFKKNSEQFGIDTTRIIVAGNSAGGMIALQAVYSSQAELGARAHLPGSESLSKKHNPAGIAGIINFWGGIFDGNWLENVWNRRQNSAGT